MPHLISSNGDGSTPTLRYWHRWKPQPLLYIYSYMSTPVYILIYEYAQASTSVAVILATRKSDLDLRQNCWYWLVSPPNTSFVHAFFTGLLKTVFQDRSYRFVPCCKTVSSKVSGRRDIHTNLKFAVQLQCPVEHVMLILMCCVASQ